MAKNTNFLFRLDLLFLSTIKESDKYAYEIISEITKMTDGIVEPKHGTLYPIIYSLVEEGYITSETKIVKNKARVYYHLEKKGNDYLNKLIADYDELVQCLDLIVHGTKHYER